MPFTHAQRLALRNIMTNLYPTTREQRSLLKELGFDIGLIAFHDAALLSWDDIINKVSTRAGGLDKLLAHAIKEHDGEEALSRIREENTVLVDQQSRGMEWHGPKNERQLEKLTTGSVAKFTDVVFLHDGYLKSRAVVRIRYGLEVGTGFIIGDNLLITNNHVLPSEAVAREAEVLLNHERTLDGRPAIPRRVSLRPDLYFVTSPEDDWTAVKLEGDFHDLALDLRPATVGLNDHVNIIHHPGGQLKQVSFLANIVVYKDQKVVQYLTDTLPGSSGAPVFDMHWNVVAVHRVGLAPSTNLPIVRNEGLLIDVIINAFKVAMPAG